MILTLNAKETDNKIVNKKGADGSKCKRIKIIRVIPYRGTRGQFLGGWSEVSRKRCGLRPP